MDSMRRARTVRACRMDHEELERRVKPDWLVALEAYALDAVGDALDELFGSRRACRKRPKGCRATE
jgi:hypothetical protein